MDGNDCSADNDSIDRNGESLANLTIRNLDEATKQALRIRAALSGVSMEEEARRILKAALGGTQHPAR